MYSFEKIDIDKIDLNEYYNFENKCMFATLPWLRYLSEDNNAAPVIVRITKNDELLGYFTGLTFKKFGIKLFGSPFKGWATGYMGFDLHDRSLIKDLLEPTINFIFKITGCLYIEIVERYLGVQDQSEIKYKTEIVATLEANIDKTDEEFLKSVKKDCRKYIRQFEERGARIEIVQPDEEFAKEIHKQLSDVFAKQDLVPTFSLDKINRCLNNLKGTGHLLCLSVFEPQGKSIASFVFISYDKKGYGWCAASYREYQSFRPNEYILWFGMRHLRDLGCEVFDFAGIREYKYKWNPVEVDYLRIMAAKYPFLIFMRNAAQKAYWKLLKFRGIVRNLTSSHKEIRESSENES